MANTDSPLPPGSVSCGARRESRGSGSSCQTKGSLALALSPLVKVVGLRPSRITCRPLSSDDKFFTGVTATPPSWLSAALAWLKVPLGRFSLALRSAVAKVPLGKFSLALRSAVTENWDVLSLFGYTMTGFRSRVCSPFRLVRRESWSSLLSLGFDIKTLPLFY